MNQPLPVVLVPGLCCSARLYAYQVPDLWRVGPLTMARHTENDDLAVIARGILDSAPPSFALVGLSMGGYIAFEMLRQEPRRILKVALLGTAASPDTEEQTAQRRTLIAMAEEGRFGEISHLMLPRAVHPSHLEAMRQVHWDMAVDTGARAYVRQQRAIIARRDSRPGLGAIPCPTLMLVGDSDQVTPPERAEEIVDGIPGAGLLVVPQCGHLSTLERPDIVTPALMEFLEG